jgi:hypothetical protein
MHTLVLENASKNNSEILQLEQNILENQSAMLHRQVPTVTSGQM